VWRILQHPDPVDFCPDSSHVIPALIQLTLCVASWNVSERKAFAAEGFAPDRGTLMRLNPDLRTRRPIYFGAKQKPTAYGGGYVRLALPEKGGGFGA
jgi:hypothetical protein